MAMLLECSASSQVWVFGGDLLNCVSISMDLIGSQAIRSVPLPRLLTPAGSRRPRLGGRPDAAPLTERRRLQRLMISWPSSRGFSTCCLHFTSVVAQPMQRSLPAGWLAVADPLVPVPVPERQVVRRGGGDRIVAEQPGRAQRRGEVVRRLVVAVRH